MKPLIGITCATSYLDSNAANPQDRVNMAYTRAVHLSGGIPVILPSIASYEYTTEIIQRLDGVLFTGGTDIDPLRFNEPIHNETVEVDPWRDEAEWQLATELLNSDLPIFAICRGMQFLNVVLGGTLIQDLPTQFPTDIQHKQVEPRSQETHEIVIEDGSWLSRISGLKTAKVNSMHHQAVKDIATSLTVTSAAPDGIVESYETFEGRWLVGVQFHPEELIKENELSIKLFHEFVRICQEKA